MIKKQKHKYNTILFFGPPGIGKTTQAGLLDRKRFFYISSGELLRRNEKNTKFRNSALGKRLSKIMASGRLIPDKIMIDVLLQTIKDYINQEIFNPKKQILVLDGIPRNKSQVGMINNIFKIIKIIYIYSRNDSRLADRILKRAKKEGRLEDQNIDIIRKRLAIYKKETNKVLGYYPKTIILKINGFNAIKKIQRQIENGLNNTKLLEKINV